MCWASFGGEYSQMLQSCPMKCCGNAYKVFTDHAHTIFTGLSSPFTKHIQTAALQRKHLDKLLDSQMCNITVSHKNVYDNCLYAYRKGKCAN